MSYKPHRDYRFEYVYDAMDFVESRQCVTCIYREVQVEYPMCTDIAIPFMNEQAVAEIDDIGDKGIYCRKFEEE